MGTPDFRSAKHTVVLSDIHLADAEPTPSKHPLWKRFKQPDLFIDSSFRNLLAYLEEQIEGSIELVLNGDIFDFDSVMALPQQPAFKVNWLERKRGLNTEEPKSQFKIKKILGDHPIFAEALRTFVLHGHRVVFVTGNHDLELHWPSVRQDILQHLNLPERLQANVRFVEWFYISNDDTLIEHGNQYDAYCLCHNPVFPFILKGSSRLVHLPFGNLANKYMTNGMGLFNPNLESSYIMSFRGYLVFFFRYLIRLQPLLLWTWFWGASVTLLVSLFEGLMPADKNPLLLNERIEKIAARSNATSGTVMSLRELRVHPAIFNPLMILRELWLDRAILFAFIVFGSFQFFSFLNVFVPVSTLWFWIPLALFLPAFIFYSRRVSSDVYRVQRTALRRAPTAAKIAGVKRVVHGHTHREAHVVYKGIEVLNNGTWSPAYYDVECTRPYGKKCFTWIRPQKGSRRFPWEGARKRIAGLFEWKDPGIEEICIPEPEK